MKIFRFCSRRDAERTIFLHFLTLRITNDEIISKEKDSYKKINNAVIDREICMYIRCVCRWQECKRKNKVFLFSSFPPSIDAMFSISWRASKYSSARISKGKEENVCEHIHQKLVLKFVMNLFTRFRNVIRCNDK